MTQLLALNINVPNIKILYWELPSICRFTLPMRKYINYAQYLSSYGRTHKKVDIAQIVLLVA